MNQFENETVFLDGVMLPSAGESGNYTVHVKISKPSLFFN